MSQALSSKWEKGTSGPAGDEHHNLVASLAFTERSRSEGRTLEYLPEQAYCLMNPGSGGRTHSRQILTPQLQVRRLTPREYERLQGFPDDYTAIEYRGKPAADGPRYRTLGNSMAVPVMRWIGERISRQGSSHEH
nr:DNA cytosine methyltransferase [Desulfovibrio sp.]